jgi:hypothetical protein
MRSQSHRASLGLEPFHEAAGFRERHSSGLRRRRHPAPIRKLDKAISSSSSAGVRCQQRLRHIVATAFSSARCGALQQHIEDGARARVRSGIGARERTAAEGTAGTVMTRFEPCALTVTWRLWRRPERASEWPPFSRRVPKGGPRSTAAHRRHSMDDACDPTEAADPRARLVGRPASPRLPVATIVEVYRPHGYRCRYCGTRLILDGVLVLMHTYFPSEIGYVTTYTHGQMHPLFWIAALECDHGQRVTTRAMGTGRARGPVDATFCAVWSRSRSERMEWRVARRRLYRIARHVGLAARGIAGTLSAPRRHLRPMRGSRRPRSSGEGDPRLCNQPATHCRLGRTTLSGRNGAAGSPTSAAGDLGADALAHEIDNLSRRGVSSQRLLRKDEVTVERHLEAAVG